MARISELHYSNAYARASDTSEFLEVALEPGENPADFSVGFYNANASDQSATQGIAISLDDPGVIVNYDADADEYTYVISADEFPILLTDPNGGGSTNYEAYALVNTDTSDVIDFYDIGRGTSEMTAIDGIAAGEVSENLPVPTGANAARYSLQFNKPNVDELLYESISLGDTGAICFAAGTLIETPSGGRPVETLGPGDEVVTVDSSVQKIKWVGCQSADANGRQAPVEFAVGAVGNDRTMLLSPQHRVLRCGWDVELMFAETEVLIPASKLVGLPGIRRMPTARIAYHHFLLESHHLVRAEGVACESFYPGDMAIGTLSDPSRAQLLSVLPDRASGLGSFGPMARPTVDGRSAVAFGGVG